MNSLRTLYFPGTDIYSPDQFPLFLLFRPLLLIKAVEPVKDDPAVTLADSFINSGLCQVETPAPLGEDRKRFLHLLKDIKERQDEYAAQLNSLTLASLSTNCGAMDDTERSIIRSLHGRPKEEPTDRNRREQLWQARLILAIGELLDHQEEEVARQLLALEHEEASLFNGLHGDLDDSDADDNPLEELQRLRLKRKTAHSGNIRKRYRAWRHLLLAGEHPSAQILLTINQDAADMVLERYEQLTDTTAPLCQSLEIPTHLGLSPAEAIDRIEDFSNHHQRLVDEFHALLLAATDPSPKGQPAVPDKDAFIDFNERWTEQLAISFPKKHFGRTVIRLYLLSGMPVARLLAQSSPTLAEGSGSGLLAVVG